MSCELVRHFHVLHFHVLSCVAIWSVSFVSCIFTPWDFGDPSFSGPAFSVDPTAEQTRDPDTDEDLAAAEAAKEAHGEERRKLWIKQPEKKEQLVPAAVLVRKAHVFLV